nr:2A [mischivirus A1]
GPPPENKRESVDQDPHILELDSYPASGEEEEDDFHDMEDHSDILLGGDVEENPG